MKFGGLKFLEAAHVKDVLAVLRLAENPRDRVAGFRVLQLLPGIGPATAAQALAGRHGASDATIALAGARAARRRARWRGLARLRAGRRASAQRERAAGPPNSERVEAWYVPQLERLSRRRARCARRPRPARQIAARLSDRASAS